MNERKWIDIEPAEPSLSAYKVSKKVINLIGRIIVGKHAWQQEVDQKEDISTCSDILGTILYFRALQGHS